MSHVAMLMHMMGNVTIKAPKKEKLKPVPTEGELLDMYKKCMNICSGKPEEDKCREKCHMIYMYSMKSSDR
jgi:hypothetical protein